MATPRRKGQHGGTRQGKPGAQYVNRTDLQQAPRAATGQTYGAAKAQIDAQKVVPLSQAPAPGVSPSPVAAGPGGGGMGAPIPLTAPTTRPNEPITSGLPTGPGPGPEALNMPSPDETMLAVVRRLYQITPNDDLARLIAELDTRLDTSPTSAPAGGSGKGLI